MVFIRVFTSFLAGKILLYRPIIFRSTVDDVKKLRVKKIADFSIKYILAAVVCISFLTSQIRDWLQ